MSVHNASSLDIAFLFKGVKFTVMFEDGCFGSEEEKRIKDFIAGMSSGIMIDKSYVECESNKHGDTFMLENGWDALKDLLLDSHFGQFMSHPATKETLIDAFTTMLRCYMYEMVSKNADIEHIMIDVDPSSAFDVVVCRDRSHDWRKYPGKWQSWSYDDNGGTKPSK